MIHIEVVAALTIREDSVLVAQRQKGEFAGMWEFPGGKIESGESHEQALQREILEELNLPISVDQFFMTIKYQYPSFHLTMHCYLCTALQTQFENLEHSEVRFVSFDHLSSLNWIPADVEVVENLLTKKG
ncbi:MAG TPA: 8-oxo-dGTP diphosphatase MutT [Erysipelotrichaceae bacterium]|nr:8-oxo-dGTP diphosphatase MutT [Erysipelotrichaceae bacterium]